MKNGKKLAKMSNSNTRLKYNSGSRGNRKEGETRMHLNKKTNRTWKEIITNLPKV